MVSRTDGRRATRWRYNGFEDSKGVADDVAVGAAVSAARISDLAAGVNKLPELFKFTDDAATIALQRMSCQETPCNTQISDVTGTVGSPYLAQHHVAFVATGKLQYHHPCSRRFLCNHRQQQIWLRFRLELSAGQTLCNLCEFQGQNIDAIVKETKRASDKTTTGQGEPRDFGKEATMRSTFAEHSRIGCKCLRCPVSRSHPLA